MNYNNTSNINFSQDNDPEKSLIGKVVGIRVSDGTVVRGRVIKVTETELWLERLGGNTAMVSRSDVSRLWVTRDRKVAE